MLVFCSLCHLSPVLSAYSWELSQQLALISENKGNRAVILHFVITDNRLRMSGSFIMYEKRVIPKDVHFEITLKRLKINRR